MWSNCVKNVMSDGAKTASIHSTKPMGIPRWVLEKTSFRLCPTFSEQHVHDCCGWLYQVVGSVSDVTTLQATVTKLRRQFAAYGLPEQIVTDATTFTSEEFQTFLSSRMGFCTQQVHQDIQWQMVRLRDMSRLLKQVWKNLPTQPWTLMTDCPCSCFNIGQHQTVQRDSLQLICFYTDTSAQGWIYWSPAQRRQCAKDSTNRKTAMTAVLQTDHLAWVMLCTCAALWEGTPSGFQGWWWDRLALCHMRSESEILTQYTDTMETSWEPMAEPDTVLTDPHVEQLVGKDCSSSQDIVDSTVPSPELLEPEPLALRRSTWVSKPPKRFMQQDRMSILCKWS